METAGRLAQTVQAPIFKARTLEPEKSLSVGSDSKKGSSTASQDGISFGRYPIWAYRGGHVSVLPLLWEAGADKNSTSNDISWR